MRIATRHIAAIVALTSLVSEGGQGVVGVSVLPSVAGITGGRKLVVGLLLAIAIIVLLSLIIVG